jgi:hypothetical protein
MTRKWPLYFSLGLLAVFIGYRFNDARSTQDNIAEDGSTFLNWPPTATEVVRLTAANGTDPKTSDGLHARDRFAEAFKSRYRLHNPMIAIGLRFREDNLFDLMVPARMEPWNMDRIAVEAWKESMSAFGHPFNIDIYISYIGVPRIKVGELRQNSALPGKVTIVHLKKGISMPAARHTIAVDMRRFFGQSRRRRGGPGRGMPPFGALPPASVPTVGGKSPQAIGVNGNAPANEKVKP